MPQTVISVFPDVDAFLAMTVEERALFLIKYLRGNEKDTAGMLLRANFTWSEELRDYASGRVTEVTRAMSEAWMWLECEGMIAPRPNDSNRDAVYVTDKGQQLQTPEDLSAYWFAGLLNFHMLERELARTVLPLFRPEDYDTPVFKALREVEVRTRKAAGLADTDIGVQLMRKAFSQDTGPLTDKALPKAEQQAMADLFAGAIGLFKNPSSHREVVRSPEDAAAIVLLANLLVKVLARLVASGAEHG